MIRTTAPVPRSDTMAIDTPAGPLAGLRILDISTVVAGPFAATLLADLDVLKAEKPHAADPKLRPSHRSVAALEL